ncbi:T9SS type A sorting domain-containing protein [Winogradskyella endarachnes]|uniref:T9SS type A sorting domain-containing protein n=1 Tax=Winogradskyella endarachnes TaxID=2681965 RepID=A0A6L6UBK6_9FLAO|nr:T9SS type A sorting domain-containing protein [Winogradskyella endarachnes]MUU78916.1 T9SS type A sorting domain-containing protein [Winogradskyella endarachnes]
MVKNYVTFSLFFLFTLILSSQNITGNWNVISLESNGNTISLPATVTTAPNINFDVFEASPPAGPYDQYWGRYINGNGICNSFTSYFHEFTTEFITLIPYFDSTDNTCTTTEETDFENLFFAILQQPGNLTYTFSNNLHNLSFTNSLGEVINLGRENAMTNLLSGEWFIHSIWEYDLLFENTFDPNLSIIFSDEIINGQSNVFGSSTCNGFNASYDNPIQTNSIVIRNMGWTLSTCNTTDEQYFESSYNYFFHRYNEDIYTFEILGTGSDAILNLHNGYLSTITYGRQALSIEENLELTTKLITDSVNNQLHIISDNDLTNSEYAIYDVSGRQIQSNYIDASNRIDLINISSGIYVLTIKNSKNQLESFKFIKG